MSCDLCDYAEAHGWWGDTAVTHCRGCHGTWRRTGRTVECSRCHLLFSGPSNFDKHIRKGGEHAHPEEVGLEKSENEYGAIVWRSPAADEPWWHNTTPEQVE